MVKMDVKGKDAQPAEHKGKEEGKPEQKAGTLPLAGEKGGMSRFGIGVVDTALKGGMPGGSCVLLAGGSGVGKTILAMQWLFNGYRTYKEPGIYITTTEPVFKAIANMKKFTFFDPTCINPMQVHMTDLRSIMQDLNIDYTKDAMSWQDVENILSVVKNLVEGMGAKRLVLDSVTAVCYRLKDKSLIRSFIFKLGTMLSNLDCTTLLTSEVASKEKMYSPFGIEEFISDGILKLEYVPRGDSQVRALNIVKMRGTDFDPSPHYYTITAEGHAYYPRMDLVEVQEFTDTRIATGISGLDRMVMGGFFKGTTTLLTGSAGTGKSLFCVQFLQEGAKARQKGLLISYEEPKAQIYKDAKTCPGADLEQLEKAGLIRVVSRFPENLTYEEHFQLIMREVESFRPERVVIDSLSSLEKVFPPESLIEYTRRVNFYLKRQGCTSILINASEGIFETGALTHGHLSTIPDCIILLKYVEIKSVMKRFITVLKVRGSDHDKCLREYVIEKNGINVRDVFKGMQGLLTGNVQHHMEQEEIINAFRDLSKSSG